MALNGYILNRSRYTAAHVFTATVGEQLPQNMNDRDKYDFNLQKYVRKIQRKNINEYFRFCVMGSFPLITDLLFGMTEDNER